MAKKATTAATTAVKPKRKRKTLTPYAKAVKAVKSATLALNKANAAASKKRTALADAETHLATFKK